MSNGGVERAAHEKSCRVESSTIKIITSKRQARATRRRKDLQSLRIRFVDVSNTSGTLFARRWSNAFKSGGIEMKTLFRSLALSGIAAILLLPALAQTNSSQASSTTSAVPSKEEAWYALYQKFLDTYETDRPTAYKVAQQCLQKYPQATEETKYLKRWVDDYDDREKTRKGHFRKLIDVGRFNEAFALGKEILAADPEDVGTLINLIECGLGAMPYGNQALVADASNYAKKALNLIEVGQLTEENKRKTLGWLNRALGIFSLISAPADAAIYFYKAMRFEGFKSDAYTYSFLADAILGAEYMPLQEEYSSRFATPAQKALPEAKVIRIKLNLVSDHVIDALARAVALAASDADLVQEKVRWMKVLTDLYKFRNSGYETGLSEYIEVILNKPFVPQPLPY